MIDIQAKPITFELGNQLKTGILLINIGTPDSPSVPDVRKYLKEFLGDKRVIDIPFLSRSLLVNLVIAPFRAKNSAKLYQKIWDENGSPLLHHSVDAANKLQEKLGEGFVVKVAMRYQKPHIQEAFSNMLDANLSKIIVLPLFPQYASASTGSAHEYIMDTLKGRQIIPEIHFISNFFDNKGFIRSFVELAKPYLSDDQYDHVLFSYHGLPERQIKKGDSTGKCLIDGKCCNSIHAGNYYCYRAQCFATSRLLAQGMGLDDKNYSVSFQSRLGRNPWIKPYTDDLIRGFSSNGIKKVLVLVPSFVADCLETVEEVGSEYKTLFLEHGGIKWQMVPSLNGSPAWIDTLAEMVKKY